MKAKLIKKGEIKPAQRPEPKPVKQTARPGGPAVNPRAAFAALFVGGKGAKG